MGSAGQIQAAVAEQFVGAEAGTPGGLTGQLATLTQSIAAITINEEDGTVEGTQAQAIAAAVGAVQGTMTTIEELKEAEGLSDTVVDAIGILENAWEELREVELGTGANGGTRLDAINNVIIKCIRSRGK